MQTLRNAHHLARFVLVWFVLTLGVAVASPVVQPRTTTLICSDAGVLKLIVQDDDGHGVATGHTLDCPLCLMAGAPPAVDLVGPLAERAQALLQRGRAAVHLAANTASPPPARAPPAPRW